MPVSFKRVAIAKVGDWPSSYADGTRGDPFTEELFDKLLAADAKKPVPKIGIGHNEDRHANGRNGTPALGTLSNLSKDTDPRDGVTTLYADLNDMPAWLPKAFPERSVELWHYEDGDVTLARLAMLGDEVPAVYSLEPTDEQIAQMVTDEGPVLATAAAFGARAVYGAAVSTPLPAEIKPSPKGPEHTDTEDTGMSLDPKLVARSLGMPEDSTVEAINTEAEARAKALVEEAEKVTETEAVVETEQPTQENPVVTASAKAVTIEPARLAALEAAAARGVEADKARLHGEAVAIVSAAASDQKILDDDAAKAEYVKDLTERGDTARNETLRLLTASATEGGFVKGRTGIPTGGHQGHSVTAASATGSADGPITEAEYEAYKNQNGATA